MRNKLKFFISILILGILVLVGAGCKKEAEEGVISPIKETSEVNQSTETVGQGEESPAEEEIPAGEETTPVVEEETPPVEETTPVVEEETPPVIEEEKEQLPQPPLGTVSIYKGFWMPVVFMSDSLQSMSGVSALKDVGANIVLLGPTVEINTEGEVFLGNPYSNLSLFEDRLKQLAQRYYSSGIRIGLVIEVLYVQDFGQGVPPGGPPPFPSDVTERPGFFDKYNALVGQLAELAEKYQLEIFSPMNEPDLKLEAAGASKWGKEILPIVKTNYNGKVLFKNAFATDLNSQIDFSGYDIIGSDPTPGGGPDALTVYRVYLREMIGNMQSWAQRDGVPEIMFTEFGAWGGALGLSEPDKTLVHRIVFEEGQGKVQGFFALDPPPDLDRGLFGTQTLAEIKTWFKEKL